MRKPVQLVLVCTLVLGGCGRVDGDSPDASAHPDAAADTVAPPDIARADVADAYDVASLLRPDGCPIYGPGGREGCNSKTEGKICRWESSCKTSAYVSVAQCKWVGPPYEALIWYPLPAEPCPDAGIDAAGG